MPSAAHGEHEKKTTPSKQQCERSRRTEALGRFSRKTYDFRSSDERRRISGSNESTLSSTWRSKSAHAREEIGMKRVDVAEFSQTRCQHVVSRMNSTEKQNQNNIPEYSSTMAICVAAIHTLMIRTKAIRNHIVTNKWTITKTTSITVTEHGERSNKQERNLKN
jgi:hypothetical protein